MTRTPPDGQAVISGGGSGIGLALARRLVARGMRVHLLGRGEERLAGAVRDLGAHATSNACDVADGAQVTQALASLDRLDLLVANAGIPGRSAASATDADTARRVMETNYLGMVTLTAAAHSLLRQAPRPTIVNVCSVAGVVPLVTAAPYAASKHAALAWSRALAAERKETGIHVLTVNPGPVETPGFPQRELLEHAIARRFVLSPDACAAAIVRALDASRTEVFVPPGFRAAGIVAAIAPGFATRLTGRRPG